MSKDEQEALAWRRRRMIAAADRAISDADRAQRRADMVPAISKLTRSAEWREAHPERQQAIIPVLPDDTMAYVLWQIADAGGSAYLALTIEDDIRLLAVNQA